MGAFWWHVGARLVVTSLLAWAYLELMRRYGNKSREWCTEDHLDTDCMNAEGRKAVKNNGTDLQLIMPSYGQTGTTSVTVALRELGFRAFHADDYSVLSRTVMWDGPNYGRWSEGVTKCRMEAMSLEPIVDVLPVALKMSPKAKVIMTWRRFDKWHKSTTGSRVKEIRWGVVAVAMQKGGRLFPWVETWDYFFGTIRRTRQEGDYFPGRRPISQWIYRTLCNGYAWPANNVYDRGTFKSRATEEAYLSHQNEIRMLVPKERLLEFDVSKHGWAELEAFLGTNTGRVGPLENKRTKKLRTNEVVLETNFSTIGWALFIFCSFNALNWTLLWAAVWLPLLCLWTITLKSLPALGLEGWLMECGQKRLAAVLEESPVVAVLDGAEAKDVVPLGRALAEAGVRMIAVPLVKPGAEQSLQQLSEALPEGVMAGGVLPIPGGDEDVSEAGGHFVLCPAIEGAVIRGAGRRGLITLVSAWTPTEAHVALQAGADGMLVTSTEQPPLERIRACRDCIPGDALLLAQAPAKPEASAELFAAGVQGLVVGGASLLKAGQPHAEVAARARKLLAACRAARRSPPGPRS